MEQLIQFHADVDAKDLMNKTALHYAGITNNIIAIKILLSNYADPFVHCNSGLEPKEMVSSLEAKILLKKARKIRIVMQWVPYEHQKHYLITTLKEINDTGYAYVFILLISITRFCLCYSLSFDEDNSV